MSKKSRNKSRQPAETNRALIQVQTMFNQAVLLHQQGQLTQAQTLYEDVLKSLPRDFNSLHLLGVVAYQTHKHERAVELIAKAIEINPDMAEPYSNIGLALRALERLDEALASYDKALAIKPDYTEAYNNRGNVLKDLNRQDDALVSYDKALALKPNYADAYFNRGNALLDLKRLDEALACYDKALALKPDYADVLTNRGTVLKDLKRLDAAIADYDRAIAIKPDFAGAYWNKSLALLVVGDFAKGWELYEWRWLKGKTPPTQRYAAQPLWLGVESLKDKTILLHSEQGFGDTIQFCRYAKLVAQLGATVLLEVQPALLKLLSGLEGVSQVVTEGETLPPFDYHCPLMSLPLAFRTTIGTIPADIPYLKADPGKAAYWHTKLGVHDKPRVGLVWSGGFRPYQPEIWAVNERRNISLELISRINLPGIDFYSLQKGEPAESELVRRKLEVWPESSLFNFTQELHDFSDTAALVENLDLVICVDTSMAHLAAAMGKPVWILNRFDSCWRWLLDRDDSPWYPTAKLYRQQRMGDWESVLDRVKTDLSKVAMPLTPAVMKLQTE